MASVSHDDRRRAARLRTHQPVKLIKQPHPKVVETLTRDVSEGGVRCLTPQLFPVSSDLGVELVLFKGEEVFNVKGKAMWFRMIPHSDQFDLGISFLDLSPQDKVRLSAYVSKLAQKPGTETFKPSINIRITK